MLAPALLVTVALVPAEMPELAVPVMLPELITLAAVVAKMPFPPVMLPELMTLAKPVLAKIPYHRHRR